MDETDRKIINTLQGGFPVCESPYRTVAEPLGLTESELIDRLQRLLDSGVLSRFGPMYHTEQMGGALTLAALKVPQEQFEEVAVSVNAFPQVAHNYARQHPLNMWFVIATEHPEEIQSVIERIEQKTGLKVFNMPKLKEYYIGLRFEA